MLKLSSFIYRVSRCSAWTITLLLLWLAMPAHSENMPEYRIKAGFLYNFATFTEWPPEVKNTLNLCIHGQSPFGEHLEELQGNKVDGRRLNILNLSSSELSDCQIVFFARSDIQNLLPLLNKLSGKPVLTVADSPDAAQQGVILNMINEQNSITFEANQISARKNGLLLSSKLLRLASKVYQ